MRILGEGATGRGEQFQFAEGGSWLAGGSSNGVVRIWDLKQGRELAPFSVGPGPVVVGAFHDSNRKLLTFRSETDEPLWRCRGVICDDW